MSDIDDGKQERRGSLSPSKLDRGSPARAESKNRSRSPSASRASKRSVSRSRSRSRSRSSSRPESTRHSRSRSHSHRRRSRSRSYSPDSRRRKSESTSPTSSRRRHTGSRSHDTKEANSHGGGADVREKPDPNTCLGVFGLSLYTTERDLRDVFSRYGPLAGVNVVFDQRSGRSRGFAFVYFEKLEDSKKAMEQVNGMELDGRHIRVDYSLTKRPHTPTPGIYMGRPTHNGGGGRRGRDSHYDRYNDRYDRYNDRYDRYDDRNDRYDRYDRYDEYDYRYSRRHSPSPSYGRYRSRSRSRSYSPRRY
ncbi:transformer-2 protein homolog alpha [Dunckerocampus dactyliophorus]|uniref:transformer-2 protein homolog alpha n=1 Tax=Dunckerocampus dactyliophorus TaxID=161453 RepID=UPI00240573AA|nr:transformer-2 protein homolog alpha [Dunckerocampus dactyliophorus]